MGLEKLLSKKIDPFEKILLEAKTIVVVGLSKDPAKESHSVARYLQEHGYKILPVNPTADEILGEKVFHSLSEIKQPVDIVDVFRPSEECGQVVREALLLKPKLVWLQFGIKNEKAKEVAQKAGVVFVQDKCTRIEHKRLSA